MIATSETPNRIPEAAPSMKPWCARGAPMRGPMISSVPATSRAASNATIAGTEKREWAPCTAGRLKPSSSSPTAVSTIPTHWRREIFSPNSARR